MKEFCKGALFAMLLAVLAGCAGQNSYESLKSPDYSKVPKNLLAIHLTTTPLDQAFESRLAEDFSKCGLNLQFTKSINPKIVTGANADTVLTVEILGGTRLVNWKDPTVNSVRSINVQLTLIDVESEKNVWRSRTDLINGVDTVVTRSANEARWADELADNMAHDGVLGKCTAKSASPPPAKPTLTVLQPDKPRTVLYCENPRGYYPEVPTCFTPFKEIPDDLKLKEH